MYFLLAAFVVFTVSLSLFLNHQLVKTHKRTVQVNLQWVSWIKQCDALSKEAGEINVQGSDVLTSHDVPKESRERDAALSEFDRLFSALRSELQRNVSSANARVLLNDCSSIQKRVHDLAERIDLVFSLAGNGQFDKAPTQITLMNRNYDDVLRALDTLRAHLREQRDTYLQGQIAGANALQRYEWLVGLLIVVMVISILVYGVHLDRHISRSESHVRETQERYRLLVEQSTDAILVADDDWNIQFANQAACQMFGYTPEEIVHRNIVDTYLPEDRDLATRRKQPRKGEKARYERLVLRKDGSRLLAEVVVRRLAQGGSQAIFRDITERKRTEEARLRLAAIVESSHDAIISTNLEGIITSWNAAAERLYGYTADEIMGQSIAQIIPVERLKEKDDILQRISTGEHVSHFESSCIAKGGHRIPVSLTASPLKDASGAIIGTSMIVHDISERKQVEAALRESEERYRRLLTLTTDYIYTVQVEDGQATATTHGAGCVAVTGYSAEDYATDPYLWVQMAHPADRDAVKQQAERAMRGEPPPPLEHRILHKDGSVRWIRNTIVLRKDEQGTVVSYDGLVSDITERMRAEIAMRNLVAGTAGVTGSDFFPILALHLGAALDVRFVFVSDLVQRAPDRLRPLAFVADGKVESHDEYDAPDAPCGQALTGGEFYFIPDHVAEQFPKDLELAAVGACSYMGVPLRSSHDELIGLLCVVHDEPMSDPDRARDILNIFAARAAAELERQRAEETLRKTNETLRALIQSAPLGIVAVDADSRVMLWNPAAEKMFGWTENEVLGQPNPAVPAGGWAAHVELRDRAVHGEIVTGIEVQRVTRSGAPIDVALSLAPLRDAYGKIYAAIGLMADITERKRSEEQLRLQSAALEAAANAIVITDCDGTIRWVNPAFTTLTGYTREEASGANPRVLKSGKHDPAFYAELWRTVKAGNVWHGEMINRRKDGTLYTEEMTITPVRDGTGNISRFVAIKQDVTQRKQAEEELREREATLAGITDSTQDAILMMDPQGHVSYWNPAAEHILGYTRNEALGRNLHELLAPQRYQDAHQKAFPEFQRTGHGDAVGKKLELEARRKDGGEILVELSLSAVQIKGGWHAVGIIRDITARKQAELSLREANKRLEDALQELQTAQQSVVQQERLRALGAMAGGIAHDFNNALAAILGFTELLLYRPELLDDKAKAKQYLEMMNTAAKDAGNVVNRLREFYRHREQGEVFTAVDLNRLVQEAISLTQPKWKAQAEARSITIRTETELQEIPPVAGNAADLREVLTNLIFNAVDAMPHGGVITIRTHSRDACVSLEVADTGTGMTEEVHRRCLEPFFTTKGDGGTGLGLSMVYGIIQRHEGTIDIQTQLNKGTTFILALPAYGRPQAPVKTAVPAPTPLPSKRVLLVDDEEVVRKVLNEYLIHDGHVVELAANGKDGLDKFRHGRFDVVILDRAMPDMSGDQVGAAIKHSSPNVPVIMLTGFGSMMEAADEKPVGVDFVVNKPVTIDTLRKAIARAVGNN
jgi:PAS domain S-box-containing protein